MRRDARSRILGVGSAWILFAAGACGTDDSAGRTPLSVFAASSLTESFQELERGFERSHPEIDVQISFAGSQVLRLQIEQGAAADVFASANEDHARALEEAGLLAPSRTFAHNELVVIVPRDDPAGIETFADLPRAERLVVGTDAVPVGAYARQLLQRAEHRLGPEFSAAVQSHVVSKETNVRLCRAKVELGEADAAIVYRTDAVASERVVAVPIPEDLGVRASYPIAAVNGSTHPAEATAFIDYVLSEEGRATLDRHGFTTDAP